VASLSETINALTIRSRQSSKTLDKALAVVDDWIEHNPMGDAERTAFSRTLSAEKEARMRDGKSYGDDQSLVASILRSARDADAIPVR